MNAERLTAQVQGVKASGLLGKSPALVALFDFLADTAREGRAPKEAEVAAAVFARSDFDAAQDASVRVYVHRLRAKLADYYAGPGANSADRLTIPRGEYRLALAEPDDAPEAAQFVARPVWQPLLVGLVAGLLLAGVAGWAWTRPDPAERAVAATRATPFWQETVTEGPPTVIAVGDYYLFGERDPAGQVARLVREFDVNSRYDLDARVMADPALQGRYVDVGLRYYPLGIANALRDVLPVVSTPDRAVRPVRIIPASTLTPEMMRAANIVYIGYFSGLGPLRDPLFAVSRFKIGSSYDVLIDKPTRRVFESAAPAQEGAGGPARAYGYVGGFAGPNGTRVTIIAGTRDAAVMQAAEFATHAATIGPVGRGEALIAVDSIAERNLGGKAIVTGAAPTGDPWRGGPPQAFPDDARQERPGSTIQAFPGQ